MNSFFTRFETHDFSSHISDVRQSVMSGDSVVTGQHEQLTLGKGENNRVSHEQTI